VERFGVDAFLARRCTPLVLVGGRLDTRQRRVVDDPDNGPSQHTVARISFPWDVRSVRDDESLCWCGPRHGSLCEVITRPPRSGEPPEDYPVAFERRLRLQDGRNVWVRPILPTDAPELAEAIRTADAVTLRRRFLGSPPRLTPKLLRWLTTVDYVRRFALVGLDPVTGRGIAIARFEPLPEEEGVVEVAVAVDPAWRRVGLATRLVELLAEAALARGFHSFGASYLAQNRPVSAMLAHAGGAKLLISHGVAELAVELDHRFEARPV
jgi:RimJ/RimL family protein N-acetyltransferase